MSDEHNPMPRPVHRVGSRPFSALCGMGFPNGLPNMRTTSSNDTVTCERCLELIALEDARATGIATPLPPPKPALPRPPGRDDIPVRPMTAGDTLEEFEGRLVELEQELGDRVRELEFRVNALERTLEDDHVVTREEAEAMAERVKAHRERVSASLGPSPLLERRLATHRATRPAEGLELIGPGAANPPDVRAPEPPGPESRAEEDPARRSVVSRVLRIIDERLLPDPGPALTPGQVNAMLGRLRADISRRILGERVPRPDPNCTTCNGSGLVGGDRFGLKRGEVEPCSCVERTVEVPPEPP